jgi:hypothetical protein
MSRDRLPTSDARHAGKLIPRAASTSSEAASKLAIVVSNDLSGCQRPSEWVRAPGHRAPWHWIQSIACAGYGPHPVELVASFRGKPLRITESNWDEIERDVMAAEPVDGTILLEIFADASRPAVPSLCDE